MGVTVELRVHGVSGTPPEELLDRPLVRQVAGDRTAGFYRPRLTDEAYDGPVPERGGAVLEGYCWGGLTSGSPSRALWLLLLPFTLINVAPRLRPVPGREGTGSSADWPWARLAIGWLCRMLAVCLTMTLSVGAVGIGVSTMAWQCDTDCPGLPGFLVPTLTEGPVGLRVALGAVVPLLTLAVLAALSWRNSVRYDSVRPAGVDADDDTLGPQGSLSSPRLVHPLFWYGRYPVSRLRHLHLQAGTAIAATSVVMAGSGSGLRVAGLLVGAVLAGFVAVALARPQTYRRDRPGRPLHLLGWLPVAVLVVLAVVTVGRLSGTAALVMPRYDAVIVGLFATSSVLVVILFVVVAVAAAGEDRQRRPKRAMASLGTAVLAIVAVYLAFALTSGAVIFAATWARSRHTFPRPSDTRELLDNAPQLVPQSMVTAGIGVLLVGVLVGLVLLVGAGWALSRLLRHGAPVDHRGARLARDRAEAADPIRFAEVERTYPGFVPDREHTVARDYWLGRRVDKIPGYLAALVLVVGAGGTAIVGAYAVGGFRPRLDDQIRILGASLSLRDAAVWGAWLTGVLVIGVVALGALAFRVPATRKAVGIIWDLASFWPRDTHPLAPPCYAERTVPELGNRLRWYLDPSPGDPDPPRVDAVVVAGHSQGTVISMAVLLGPARGVLSRIGFLSCGTVLRRLYARFFPAYFGPADFAVLVGGLGDNVSGDATESPDLFPPGPALPQGTRWRNLWRRTDYLGGRLWHPLDPDPHQPPVEPGRTLLDVELSDPVFLPPRGDLSAPPTLRHSDFWRDPQFAPTVRTLGELAGRER